MKWLGIFLGVFLIVALTLYCVFQDSIRLKVVDEDGQPVQGAKVTFSWSTGQPWGPDTRSGTQHLQKETTNSGGLASLRFFGTYYIGAAVDAEGYYPGSLGVDMAKYHQTADEAALLYLKKKRNPVAAVAKRAFIFLPSKSGRIGYDFLMGDLVAPAGNGHFADMVIVWGSDSKDHSKQPRERWDFEFESEHGGIQAARPSTNDSHSYLISRSTAPESGYGYSLKQAEDEAHFGERGAWGSVIYYFETKRDGKNLYGKILGKPSLISSSNGTTALKFTYLLNPYGSLSLEPDKSRLVFPKTEDREEEYSLPESTE